MLAKLKDPILQLDPLNGFQLGWQRNRLVDEHHRDVAANRI
jgi:hypothetical protein